MVHIFAAALALSDPAGPVVEARIADVIADPERFGGLTLRLRGQIDACYGWACSICPEEMAPDTADAAKCLRIAFDGFGAGEAADPSLPTDHYVGREMEEAFRFSTVTAEGQFDPSCLTHRPWPPEPKAASGIRDPNAIEDYVVCTDRASTWRGVQIRAVHRRLPSNSGLLFDERKGRALRPASPDAAAAAGQAYRDYVLTFDESPEWNPVAVFQTEAPTFDEPSREAWACVCRGDDCANAWPRREISLWARTINDPYFCYFALERQGVWRIYPE